jgi:hypothetical protein
MPVMKGIPGARRRSATLALAAALSLAVLAAGCVPPQTPITGGSAGSGTKPGSANGAASAPAAPDVPAKVREFVPLMKGVPVYYPSALPAGYAFTSAAITPEAPQQGGPTLEVLFTKGDTELWCLQGSPVVRDYEIIPVEEVPFGSDTAAVMWFDPEAETGQFIAYATEGNLVEIYSETASLDDMKALAAAMVAVK